MDWLRRALLELWAMAALAILVGFLGPFGTYTGYSLVDRVLGWGALLLGAYVLVRPCIWCLNQIALRTALPIGVLSVSGVVATSLPIAMLWRAVGQNAYRQFDGYAELLPFALLCALAVLGVTRWAQAVSTRIDGRSDANARAMGLDAQSTTASDHDNGQPGNVVETTLPPVKRPRLLGRLSGDFRGPIIALQSEDHYVRVHGAAGSELILLRLRDAIAEMDGTSGEQIHRSWWIARDGVAGMVRAGRSRNVRLANGELAPVARGAVHRLLRSGFLREPALGT